MFLWFWLISLFGGSDTTTLYGCDIESRPTTRNHGGPADFGGCDIDIRPNARRESPSELLDCRYEITRSPGRSPRADGPS